MKILWIVRQDLSCYVFFLINFIGVNFEAGNETREKIWSNLVAEQKWRAEQKESGFLFIQLFLREREIDVWKNFLWASEIFLFTCGF